MATNLSPAWEAFARLQEVLERKKIIMADVFADEEALTALADSFELGEPSAEELGRRFYSLRRNRRRKHRCRRRLQDAVMTERGRQRDLRITANAFDDRDELEQLKRIVTEDNWSTFVSLADGTTVGELARVAGIPDVAFRVRLHRLRCQLRTVA